MFIQTIQGKLSDAATFEQAASRWDADLRPGAPGFLGSTWGVSPDGVAFLAARFESEAAAHANSERPEQGAWWATVEPAFADVSFQDCAEVDEFMGGGSDAAGFVQVIQGRAKDPAAARQMLRDMEGELGSSRPDILGGLMAWHGDAGGFTQVMYFRSEAEARGGEQAEGPETEDPYLEMMAVPPTFLDLPTPHFG